MVSGFDIAFDLRRKASLAIEGAAGRESHHKKRERDNDQQCGERTQNAAQRIKGHRWFSSPTSRTTAAPKRLLPRIRSQGHPGYRCRVPQLREFSQELRRATAGERLTQTSSSGEIREPFDCHQRSSIAK